MISRYDCSIQSASFDFFTWLVHCKAKGATEVVFDVTKFRTTKWDEGRARKRYKTILQPGPAFAGLPWREGTDGDNLGSTHISEVAKLPTFERLQSVQPAKRDYQYTVTLRTTGHNPHRNSDVQAWLDFAKEIGAYVIADYDQKPMHLWDRVAMYAGAEMNFGVTNGPMALLYFSDYPYMVVDCPASEKSFVSHGIKSGEQLAWANKDQVLVWERQSPESIRKAFYKWRSDR